MVVNLSKFYGIPTKRKGAEEQFRKLKREERKSAFSRGRFLVLKKLKRGKYAGNYSTFLYETKPKSKVGVLKTTRIPKARKK